MFMKKLKWKHYCYLYYLIEYNTRTLVFSPIPPSVYFQHNISTMSDSSRTDVMPAGQAKLLKVEIISVLGNNKSYLGTLTIDPPTPISKSATLESLCEDRWNNGSYRLLPYMFLSPELLPYVKELYGWHLGSSKLPLERAFEIVNGLSLALFIELVQLHCICCSNLVKDDTAPSSFRTRAKIIEDRFNRELVLASADGSFPARLLTLLLVNKLVEPAEIDCESGVKRAYIGAFGNYNNVEWLKRAIICWPLRDQIIKGLHDNMGSIAPHILVGLVGKEHQLRDDTWIDIFRKLLLPGVFNLDSATSHFDVDLLRTYMELLRSSKQMAADMILKWSLLEVVAEVERSLHEQHRVHVSAEEVAQPRICNLELCGIYVEIKEGSYADHRIGQNGHLRNLVGGYSGANGARRVVKVGLDRPQLAPIIANWLESGELALPIKPEDQQIRYSALQMATKLGVNGLQRELIVAVPFADLKKLAIEYQPDTIYDVSYGVAWREKHLMDGVRKVLERIDMRIANPQFATFWSNVKLLIDELAK
jgi:hypothetical protein